MWRSIAIWFSRLVLPVLIFGCGSQNFQSRAVESGDATDTQIRPDGSSPDLESPSETDSSPDLESPSLRVETNRGTNTATWNRPDFADLYELRRARSEDMSEATTVFHGRRGGAGQQTYEDREVQSGTTYYYQLTARSEGRASHVAHSEIVSVETSSRPPVIDTIDTDAVNTILSVDRKVVENFGGEPHVLDDGKITTLNDQLNNRAFTGSIPSTREFGANNVMALDHSGSGKALDGKVDSVSYPFDVFLVAESHYSAGRIYFSLAGDNGYLAVGINSGQYRIRKGINGESNLHVAGKKAHKTGVHRISFHGPDKIRLYFNGMLTGSLTGEDIHLPSNLDRLLMGKRPGRPMGDNRVQSFYLFDEILDGKTAVDLTNDLSKYIGGENSRKKIEPGVHTVSPADGQQLEAQSDYVPTAFFHSDSSQRVEEVAFQYSTDGGQTFPNQIGPATKSELSGDWIAADSWKVPADTTHVRTLAKLEDGTVLVDDHAVDVVGAPDLYATTWHDPADHGDVSGLDHSNLTPTIWLNLDASKPNPDSWSKRVQKLVEEPPGRGAIFMQIGSADAYLHLLRMEEDEVRNPDGSRNKKINENYPAWPSGIERLKTDLGRAVDPLVTRARRHRTDVQISHIPLDNEWHEGSQVPHSPSDAYIDAIQQDPRWPQTRQELEQTHNDLWDGESFNVEEIGDGDSNHSKTWSAYIESKAWHAYGDGVLGAVREWFPNATMSEYNASGISHKYRAREYNGHWMAGSENFPALGDVSVTAGGTPDGIASYHQYRWLGQVADNQKVRDGPWSGLLLDMIKLRAMERSRGEVMAWTAPYSYYQGGLIGIDQESWQTYWKAHIRHTLWEAACTGGINQFWNSYTGAGNTVQLDHEYSALIDQVNKQLGNEQRRLVTDRKDYWKELSLGEYFTEATELLTTCVQVDNSKYKCLLTPHIPYTTTVETSIRVRDESGSEVDSIAVPDGTDPGTSFVYSTSEPDHQFTYRPQPTRPEFPPNQWKQDWSSNGVSVKSTAVSDPDNDSDAVRLAKTSDPGLYERQISLEKDTWYALTFEAKLMSEKSGDYFSGQLMRVYGPDGQQIEAAKLNLMTTHNKWDEYWATFKTADKKGKHTLTVKPNWAYDTAIHDLVLQKGSRASPIEKSE